MADENILDLCSMSEKDTKLLNDIYTKYKRSYMEMLDKIGKEVNTIYWWATPLSSKYWYLSESLKNISIAILGIKEIQRNQYLKEIYCPSEEIARTIKRYCRNVRREIHIKIKKGTTNVSFRRQLLVFEQSIREKCNRHRKIAESLKREKIISPEKEKSIVLIDTYIKSSETSEAGYEEQYFRNLLDYTEENIYFFPQIILNTEIPVNVLVKRILNGGKYKYIFREQFLRIPDYYKMFFYPFFCIILCLKKKYINGIDVTAIINRDLLTGITSDNSMEGMIKFFAIKRMRKQGIKIDRLIGWYEGQPSSNMLFLGYRKAYHYGKSVGYIGYAIDKNNINVAPGREQIRHKAGPQKIAVMAECFRQIPQQFNKIKVIIVPALRLQKSYQYTEYKEKDEKRILVALSYERKTSREILIWIKRMESYYKENDIVVYIKNHPCNAEMTLKRYGIQKLNCTYKYVEEEFHKVVRSVDIVITVQSTSGYEAALHGKPVIFINFSSQLNINYMPKEWEGSRYDTVYNTDELEIAIEKYFNRDLERVNLDNEKYHVRVSRDTIERLFE